MREGITVRYCPYNRTVQSLSLRPRESVPDPSCPRIVFDSDGLCLLVYINKDLYTFHMKWYEVSFIILLSGSNLVIFLPVFTVVFRM